jgi:hypothetical protein
VGYERNPTGGTPAKTTLFAGRLTVRLPVLRAKRRRVRRMRRTGWPGGTTLDRP